LLYLFVFYSIIFYDYIINYIFSISCFFFTFSLITSTLSTMIRDTHQFLNSILRMLFYVSGVLWPLTLLEQFPTILQIAKLNPIYYLVQGYRAAFFGTEWYFITHWQYTLYFWLLVIVLFLIGAHLHIKFRRHFIDYL